VTAVAKPNATVRVEGRQGRQHLVVAIGALVLRTPMQGEQATQLRKYLELRRARS
jgi:hypothetical protein